jgi:hypothetical protein
MSFTAATQHVSSLTVLFFSDQEEEREQLLLVNKGQAQEFRKQTNRM